MPPKILQALIVHQWGAFASLLQKQTSNFSICTKALLEEVPHVLDYRFLIAEFETNTIC